MRIPDGSRSHRENCHEMRGFHAAWPGHSTVGDTLDTCVMLCGFVAAAALQKLLDPKGLPDSAAMLKFIEFVESMGGNGRNWTSYWMVLDNNNDGDFPPGWIAFEFHRGLTEGKKGAVVSTHRFDPTLLSAALEFFGVDSKQLHLLLAAIQLAPVQAGPLVCSFGPQDEVAAKFQRFRTLFEDQAA